MKLELDKKIEEFKQSIYEPEHEDGQTCWCKPITTVDTVSKKAFIDHNEERERISNIYRDVLYGAFYSIGEAEEWISQQDNNSEFDTGFNKALEMVEIHLREQLGLQTIDKV